MLRATAPAEPLPMPLRASKVVSSDRLASMTTAFTVTVPVEPPSPSAAIPAYSTSKPIRCRQHLPADNANTALSGGYTVWDAALSWRPQARSTYRLSVRNLTDKLYTYSAVSSAKAAQAYPGEGRRVDLTAEFAF